MPANGAGCDLPGSARNPDGLGTAEAGCPHLQGDGAPAEAQRPEQNVSTTVTVGDVLSVSQLLLRRGGALLVMLLILAAGILLSHFLTKLLK